MIVNLHPLKALGNILWNIGNMDGVERVLLLYIYSIQNLFPPGSRLLYFNSIFYYTRSLINRMHPGIDVGVRWSRRRWDEVTDNNHDLLYSIYCVVGVGGSSFITYSVFT